LQCGFAKTKGQLKKDGTPMWHCPFKWGFDYFIVYNESGEKIKSYNENEWDEKFIPLGGSFKKHNYKGCPYFNKI
jgi:hypothetical protein